jgi:predicted unusual protein kinase regulating ubiquinone biosynthesis (AarF/ABC1/UbiB family)
MAPPTGVPRLNRFGWPELVRAAEIVAVLTLWLAWAVVRHRPRSRLALAEAASAGAVEAMMVLGPTFVKLGQLIASSPGLFPAPLADACLRTLHDVPPFASARVQAIIAEDLGATPADLFASFDPAPLSAASIAQVHACILADGRDAVVKVQRPAIGRRMNRDLRIMYRFARLIDRTRRGRLMNAPGIVEDLHRVSNEELDFELEARRQTGFRQHIGDFGDNKWVTAPQVYQDLCGPRVICMERLFGTPLDDFAELRRRGIDGELVLRRGVKVWMEAALVHGPFHGDVHAGNMWVLDDGRAAYLDFGIMGELPPRHRDALRDAQYTLMIDGDYTRIVRAWQRIGLFSDDVGPVDEVAARLRAVVEPMLDLRLGEASLAEVLHQQLELQREYRVRAIRELMLVSKQLMYFERYAKELAPDYNMGRDLFLVQNIFPAEVARLCEERDIALPDDSLTNLRRR